MDIHRTDGTTTPSVIVIWDDLGTELAGMYRAFWCDSPDGDKGSPIVGYGSGTGSHRTVAACAAQAKRMFPGEPVYRNGREIK